VARDIPSALGQGIRSTHDDIEAHSMPNLVTFLHSLCSRKAAAGAVVEAAAEAAAAAVAKASSPSVLDQGLGPSVLDQGLGPSVLDQGLGATAQRNLTLAFCVIDIQHHHQHHTLAFKSITSIIAVSTYK